MRIILTCCLILSALLTRSQDNHYNWMQFGSRNSIVFNAGVSRFEDQSAVIMNPATLTGAETSSFNFNTNVIAMNNITFEDGFGKGFTVKTSQFNVLPSMASGVFKPRQESKKWTMGYALYHSMADQIDFSDRVQDRRDLIPEAEGPGSVTEVPEGKCLPGLVSCTAEPISAKPGQHNPARDYIYSLLPLWQKS